MRTDLAKGLRVAAASVVASSGATVALSWLADGPAGAAATPALGAGQTLAPGQALVDGPFTLAMQTDGNLVEYKGSAPVWATGTGGHPGNDLAMQPDGNLVLYSGSSAVWQTHTEDYPGAHLALMPDGDVIVYDGNTPLWAKSWRESVGGAQAYARVLLPEFGWGAGQYKYLNALWSHESNWRWDVCNGGATYPDCDLTGSSYGIPQSFPGDKMAADGTDWAVDGETQVQWGLTYIAQRYGSPEGAYDDDMACGYCGYARHL
jgi:hypothetical protein